MDRPQVDAAFEGNGLTSSPTVSVVMPVYNGAAHVGEAIDSLLAQTFTDWELVAVDDGSTDDSWAVLSASAERDERIRPHRFDRNQGHCAASNEVLRRARGQYLVRLDQDDLATPTRLQRTVDAFEADPDVGLLHGQYVRWLPDGRRILRYPPATDTALRIHEMFHNTACHSALAIRSSVLAELGEGYRELPGPQDYDLIVRALEVTRALCVAEPLAIYRQSSMAMTEMFSDRMEEAVGEISARQLRRYLPDKLIGPARRAFGLEARGRDWRGVAAVHRVLSASKRDPRLDATEVEAIRHAWTRRALRAALSRRGTMARDPRLVAALVRHDPAGSLRIGRG